MKISKNQRVGSHQIVSALANRSVRAGRSGRALGIENEGAITGNAADIDIKNKPLGRINKSLKQSIFSTRTSDNITSVAKSVAVVVAVGALVALAAYAAPYAKALLPGVKK